MPDRVASPIQQPPCDLHREALVAAMPVPVLGKEERGFQDTESRHFDEWDFLCKEVKHYLDGLAIPIQGLRLARERKGAGDGWC